MCINKHYCKFTDEFFRYYMDNLRIIFLHILNSSLFINLSYYCCDYLYNSIYAFFYDYDYAHDYADANDYDYDYNFIMIIIIMIMMFMVIMNMNIIIIIIIIINYILNC